VGAAALLGWAAPAAAETVALSQEQAVGRAVKRHPLVQASRHGAAAAESKVDQARTGWFPRIKLEGGYQYVGPQQRMKITQEVDLMPEPIVIERDIGSVHNASVGLTVAWRAYDFGARTALADAAKAAAQAARAEGDERAAEVAYATRAAYLAALFFQELATVTQRSLKVARTEYREQRVKKKAGVGSELDVARIETRVAELQARLTRARQERARALVTLRLLLGLPGSAELRLTDSLEGLAQTGGSPGVTRRGTGQGAASEGNGGARAAGSGGAHTAGSGGARAAGSGGAHTAGSGGARAAESGGAHTAGSGGARATESGGALVPGDPREEHPTRRRLDALKRATEARLSERWRSYWPTLDVVGNVRYQYPKNYFEIEGGLFYMAGIRLTWNVFDGDLLRRQRAELRAKVRQVESLREAADEDVRRKLADAAAKRRIAAASAAAARRTRRAARVYLEAARVSREAGTGTALEVRKAEEKLDQAQLAEVKAWFESALAWAEQLRAQGVAKNGSSGGDGSHGSSGGVGSHGSSGGDGSHGSSGGDGNHRSRESNGSDR
jgi:outer membrane protein TolC